MNILEVEASNRDRRAHLPFDIDDDEAAFGRIKHAFKDTLPVVGGGCSRLCFRYAAIRYDFG